MCHRFNQRLNQKQLTETFGLTVDSPLFDTDRFPTKPLAVIRPTDDGRELMTMEWGLLPRWWKPSAKSKSRHSFQRRTFNAVSEEVHAKPSYRDAFKRRRCLVPVAYFFEKDYCFGLRDDAPFAFAGLWEQWQGDGEQVESCTFLTTRPNALVEQYHRRMPVMLTSEEEFALWLNADIVERQPLERLFEPYDADKMKCWRAA